MEHTIIFFLWICLYNFIFKKKQNKNKKQTNKQKQQHGNKWC